MTSRSACRWRRPRRRRASGRSPHSPGTPRRPSPSCSQVHDRLRCVAATGAWQVFATVPAEDRHRRPGVRLRRARRRPGRRRRPRLPAGPPGRDRRALRTGAGPGGPADRRARPAVERAGRAGAVAGDRASGSPTGSARGSPRSAARRRRAAARNCSGTRPRSTSAPTEGDLMAAALAPPGRSPASPPPCCCSPTARPRLGAPHRRARASWRPGSAPSWPTPGPAALAGWSHRAHRYGAGVHAGRGRDTRRPRTTGR